jgi:hypothetical protein
MYTFWCVHQKYSAVIFEFLYSIPENMPENHQTPNKHRTGVTASATRKSVLTCITESKQDITYYNIGHGNTLPTNEEYVCITITNNKTSSYKFCLPCKIQNHPRRVYALLSTCIHCMFVLLGGVQYCLILVSPQDKKRTSINTNNKNTQVVFDIVPFDNDQSLCNLLNAVWN